MKTLFLGLMMVGLTALGADTAALLSGTPQEKAALAQTLAAAKDESAVDALAKAALDSDPAVAYAAADALGAVGSAKAADALLAALKSGSLDALAGGKLAVAFKTKRDQALVNGLEVLETGAEWAAKGDVVR